MNFLENYLKGRGIAGSSKEAIAFFSALDVIHQKSPEVAKQILGELKDQRSHLKLIASENYSSLATQFAMGNLFTDKYSEGYVGHRFYAGCEHVDEIESRGINLVKEIFNAEHAYIQPHSGADANLIALWAILFQKIQDREIEKLSKKNVNELTEEEHEKVRKIMLNQKVMGMSLNSGGHLTHGYRFNITSKMMQSFPYEVDFDTGLLNYDKLSKQVKEVKPLILIAGYSAYSRLIDFAKMREIADSVGAVLLVDMAHFAGLVAGKVMTGVYSPVEYAHIITSTTHKTLRGPRGGFILCKKEYKEIIDRGCPIVMGGPLPHVMAAKVVAFEEVKKPEFQSYAKQIVLNAKALAERLMQKGAKVMTNGTDNHIVLLDVFSTFGVTGRQVELAFREAKITVNRNSIFNDKNGPWYTSGIRLGSSAITSLGMKEKEMEKIADWMVDLLKHMRPLEESGKISKAKYELGEKVMHKCVKNVEELLSFFPLYPELSL